MPEQLLPDRILEMHRCGIDPKEVERILQREGVSQAAIMTAVFSLAASGKLQPTSAAAEIKVQDAAEAAQLFFDSVAGADGLVSANDLAAKLGMSPRNMRRFIKRHRKELEQFGPIAER